ncbi:MAG TPA: TonB-dependent receptor [Pyrinomonadaceae bacterium]|nr:TonB-dependent receptor [Pyrinomonadaceae bacterium]
MKVKTRFGLRQLRAVVVLLFLLASASAPSQARQRASGGGIEGAILDAGGGAVAGAQVQLFGPQHMLLKTTESDAAGHFRFENVAPGALVLHISRRDFASRDAAVRVVAGETAKVEVRLEVGTFAEEVTVTAETGLAEAKRRVPQQVNIIPEDEIRQRATAVLAQVADEEEGVSLQRTSPTVGAVLVRGLTEVGVYVDGVRYTNSTQRGGINTFFNLNEPSNLRSVELLRGPNTAQYGSDSLGGTVQLVSRQPEFGYAKPETHGEFNTFFTSADASFGGNALVTYGTERFGILMNTFGRRVNTLRPGGGFDTHSAVTRFLGLRSDVLGTRLPDTAFTQYGGTLHLSFAPTDDQKLSFRYQRSQQDGGKRYDQLLGGDGNLVADLRNLMLDFFYGRYFKQGAGFFDSFSATVSYNSQREERVNQGGQGNPLAAITHDKERTTSVGLSFFLDKQFSAGHNFLFGGDIYRDHVDAPSFTFQPDAANSPTGTVTLTRPRVPHGSRFILAGIFVQDSFDAVRDRLRLSGALRYNVGSYRSRAANSPLVGDQPLFPDDSLRVADFSGRIGAVATITNGLNLAFNYSRGFRAPNITALGSTGLVGVGFQVATSDVVGLGATIGSTADANAVSTGVEVSPLSSETSDNFDLSLRFRRGRLDTSLTGFVIDYSNTIVRQTLILPPGAVGLSLGSQIIESQSTNGAVFVPLSTSPVLVQANFSETRLKGVEYTLEYRFTDALTFGGNYTYIHAADRATGEPPNLGGGGLPPQLSHLRLRYQRPGGRFWIEGYATLAGRQDRLSSLDISDRRTGGARTRAQIQNFFRRGACVRGLTTPGADGQCGSAGGVLIATGETLAQVQNRLLPIGATVNGVLVVDNQTAVPLFKAIPGYGLVNLRGGFRLDERQDISIDFENIADKNYRAPGWGIDGPGRSITARYGYRF